MWFFVDFFRLGIVFIFSYFLITGKTKIYCSAHEGNKVCKVILNKREPQWHSLDKIKMRRPLEFLFLTR